jgi:hypothetical protein
MFECAMTLFVKQCAVSDSMQAGDGPDVRCGVVQGGCNRSVFLTRVVSYDPSGLREQRRRATDCFCGAEKVGHNGCSLWRYGKSSTVLRNKSAYQTSTAQPSASCISVTRCTTQRVAIKGQHVNGYSVWAVSAYSCFNWRTRGIAEAIVSEESS